MGSLLSMGSPSILLEEEGEDTTLHSIPDGHSPSENGHKDTELSAEAMIVDS